MNSYLVLAFKVITLADYASKLIMIYLEFVFKVTKCGGKGENGHGLKAGSEFELGVFFRISEFLLSRVLTKIRMSRVGLSAFKNLWE